MNRLRHADELVGFLVLLAIMAMVGAIVEAGFLSRWFQPTTGLRILLPATGVGGLVSGAEVEVLGTHAGTVRRIVINPQQIYAEAEIDDQVRPVITRDSVAIVRRRFGVAGAAFVEIKRGSGAPMDWSFAVIDGTTERGPTDNVSALIDEAREKIFPIVTDFGRTARSLAEISGRIEHGEGSVGRVLSDDALIREVETAVATASSGIGKLDQLLAQLQDAGADAGGLLREARDTKVGFPALLRETLQVVGDVRSMTRNLKEAMARTPALMQNVNETAENLPALLQQTQMSAAQLEKLLSQLRGHWLLGGSATPAERLRLPVTQARP